MEPGSYEIKIHMDVLPSDEFFYGMSLPTTWSKKDRVNTADMKQVYQIVQL